MERELIIERLKVLGEELNKTAPGGKEASVIREELIDLWRMLNDDEKVINDRLDRNRRFDLEEMKFEAEKREADINAKQSKFDSILQVIKVAMTIGGAFMLLIGTLVIEDRTIISQKAWGLITKVFPRI